MARAIRRLALGTTVGVIAFGSLSACGANDSSTGNGGDAASGGGGKTIALLLPETKTTRYESQDKPLFEAKVKELCGDCTVTYANADQDPAKQQQQVESAITQKVAAIVLDPVDAKGATGMVSDAKAANIPVIAYDRFIEGADYYMSFNNERVGELQAQSLVDALGNKGDILMLNGAPTDPNAAQFKSGAHKIIDASGVKIFDGGEYDNPDWSPENAQKFTTAQLTKHDPSTIAGVYAANDGQAGGVIAAFTGAGVKATDLPPITGQDAELAAIQRIAAGEQFMTIYKSIKTEAEKAAEVAVAVAKGEDVGDTTDFQGVKSFIFDPVVVTKDNIADTVVKDGFYSASDICTADYKSFCDTLGIK
ncbi:substrate-binding domain-containing protein [Nocardioides sp. TRM66260-LWL]|uniref:substrate-binding domain-containing protein n=1 Tax=Nocardioides sp. TRM66260-LWL TaxID=2874478 RepID=UPI001CC41DD8|nr:substrate-binding domain-containing protein [Nocardioides sp. TRM66260-LWL]MBZ5735156.1 substrate-binding domain-containing protein [Nocardioides sp. TRM66260-LWL]